MSTSDFECQWQEVEERQASCEEDTCTSPSLIQMQCQRQRFAHTWGGSARLFYFFGRGTGPKRCGAVLASFLMDFHAEPSILDPIQATFDDFGPNRHVWASLLPGQGVAGGLALARGPGWRPWPWSEAYTFLFYK